MICTKINNCLQIDSSLSENILPNPLSLVLPLFFVFFGYWLKTSLKPNCNGLDSRLGSFEKLYPFFLKKICPILLNKIAHLKNGGPE